jgi:Recombination endonuclease VII
MAGWPRIKRSKDSKVCNACGEDKPLAEFYIRRASIDGLSYRCKSCANNAGNQWIAEKPKQERATIYHARDLKRKFGISKETFDALFLSQNGVCAICNQPNPNKNRLAVDHNHVTGQVRGLLCGPCNMLLYRVENDPDWANKAFSYLSKSVVETLLKEDK